MTSRDFCFWLQGFFEITGTSGYNPPSLSAEQAKTICTHLALVFAHEIDPSAGNAEHQEKLNKIHGIMVDARPDTLIRC